MWLMLEDRSFNSRILPLVFLGQKSTLIEDFSDITCVVSLCLDNFIYDLVKLVIELPISCLFEIVQNEMRTKTKTGMLRFHEEKRLNLCCMQNVTCPYCS